MPLLRYLPLPFQNALRDYHTIKMHVLDLVNEHRATHTPKEPRDLIDSYLDEVDKVSPRCSVYPALEYFFVYNSHWLYSGNWWGL